MFLFFEVKVILQNIFCGVETQNVFGENRFSTALKTIMAAPIVVYGVCQTGCNLAWVACCAAAGGVAGVAAPAAILPAMAYCAAQQGVCMDACAMMSGIAGVAEVGVAVGGGVAVMSNPIGWIIGGGALVVALGGAAIMKLQA